MSVNSLNTSNVAGIRFTKDTCVVVIRTEWNAAVLDVLEAGCVSVLKEHGMCYKIITVPGAFEIPFATKAYWESHKYKADKPLAFIALACVIKGDTPHFDYVCKAITEGVLNLNLLLPVPTIFGVLTVDNQQQANERMGGNHGHKGEEAAIAALKMIALQQSFSPKQ